MWATAEIGLEDVGSLILKNPVKVNIVKIEAALKDTKENVNFLKQESLVSMELTVSLSMMKSQMKLRKIFLRRNQRIEKQYKTKR